MKERRGSWQSVGVLLGIYIGLVGIAWDPAGTLASVPVAGPASLLDRAGASSSLPLEGTPTISGVAFKLQMQNGVVLVCKLTLAGTNYESGCVVLIDGQPAPKMHYDSSTQVLAKGGAKLKKMLPKGRTIVLTVRNPGGQTSAPYNFTR